MRGLVFLPAVQAAAAAERISEKALWSTKVNITRNDNGTPGNEADDKLNFVDAPNNNMDENELIIGEHVPITLDLQGPTNTAIAPNNAQAGNFVEITITGTNFDPQATAKLAKGGSTIQPTAVNRVNRTQLKATFDLSGAATGEWAVHVTNPNGQGAVFNSFAVNP